MGGKKWSEKEIRVVRDNYNQGSSVVSGMLSGRTSDAVVLMANKLGLRSEYNPWRRASVERLLGDNVEAYYWMGFLMADGHFTGTRLQLGLSKKDREHLRKFGEFVGYTGKAKSYLSRVGCRRYRYWKIACMNKKVVPEIMKKFDLVSNKTENPPGGLPIGTDEQKLALVVGFVDGDGSVAAGKRRRFYNVVVKVHGSWLGMLKRMAGLVYALAGRGSGVPKLNRRGYAQWVISNSVVTKFLKKRIVEMGLPVLRRKWKKIDEQLVGEQELAEGRVESIRAMVDEGLYQSQIARRLGVQDCVVYKLAKSHGVVIPKRGHSRCSWRGGDANVR